MSIEGCPPRKRSKQQTLFDVWNFYAYSMVFTFKNEVFNSMESDDCPVEEIWKDHLAEFLEKKMGFENVRVAIEYGEHGTNPHLDCIMTSKKELRVDNIKRRVMQVTGMSREEIQLLSPDTRERWVQVAVIKNTMHLENRVNYNLKECKKSVTKGELFTQTWLQERAEEGRKREEILRCKSAKGQYVNDVNFVQCVKEYVENLSEESRSDDLMVVLPWMDRDGYNFSRVRDKRYAIARYYALACRDTQASARYWGMFNV